jgi:hypothetical protein
MFYKDAAPLALESGGGPTPRRNNAARPAKVRLPRCGGPARAAAGGTNRVPIV